jgi:ribosomal protein S18 acetylase RimI-like enzyme
VSAVPTGATQFALRRATPEDAPAIYVLKQQAFGSGHLNFTIYRSAKTVHYIRALIADTSGPHKFRVGDDAGKVLGYSHARHMGREFFLNYIAVAPIARGLGIGTALLNQFEADARKNTCDVLGLDVCDRDCSVVRWYLAAGFKRVSQSYLYRIGLQDTYTKGALIDFDPLAFDAALAVERHLGFSKILGRIDDAEVSVGLIDGSCCKLLGYTGTTLQAAAAAIARRFAGQRSELIISSDHVLPTVRAELASQNSLRLKKSLWALAAKTVGSKDSTDEHLL